MTSEKISIIYPPPELRNIVDKTASFVARNGPEFETRIQLNEPNNPKFNFLKLGDPYHAYYQFKVKENKEGPTEEDGEGVENGDATANSDEPTTNGSNDKASSKPAEQDSEKKTQISNLTKKFESLWSMPVIIREPPPAYEFSVDPPTLVAYDLDLVKLTAQFVAVHGRSFLTNLMTREQRNYQFDFLRPQHGLFQYFTNLIEQYSKILMPQKTLVAELVKDVSDHKALVEKIRYRTEYTRIHEAQKEKEEAEAEKERLQYSQIDWHDFVIVETVDFQPSETGNFALPTTPDQVGSRLLLQQRLESSANESAPIEAEPSAEELYKDDEFKEPEVPKEILPPLPPSLDNVVIRRDYDPKAKTPAAGAGKSLPDNWVISPITGEKIPAEKVQEHMRYSLLDPRWIEQRERNIQEKMQQEDVYAPGSAIENSLKHLAERRTDIFGTGVEETHIGMKIGEDKDLKKPESTIWDGHSNTRDQVSKAARANISIEEQIQQIHKMKGLLADPDKEKIGPSVPGREQPKLTQAQPKLQLHHQQQQQQQHQQQQHHHHQLPPQHIPQPPLLNAGIPLMPNPLMRPHDPFGLQSLGVPMGMYGMPPPMQHPPPMGMPRDPMSVMGMDQMEPAFKKARTEDNLIPEEDFLANCPPQVNVHIQIPASNDKPEWNLNGQMINLTVPYRDTFATLKTKITEVTNMPQNKQKLQFDGIYVKDSNSLAFYNVPQGSVIVLGFKERGGRKK